MAFENFQIQTDPLASYFGNIDVNLVNTSMRREAQDFTLLNSAQTRPGTYNACSVSPSNNQRFSWVADIL